MEAFWKEFGQPKADPAYQKSVTQPVAQIGEGPDFTDDPLEFDINCVETPPEFTSVEDAESKPDEF